MKRRQYLNIATGLCCLIWCVSLFVPAIDFNFGITFSGSSETMIGAELLLLGWIAVPSFYQIGWIANIAFWAVIVGQRGELILFTTWSIIILFVCALSSADIIVRPDIYKVTSVRIGYWVWMTANFALCSVVLIKRLRDSSNVSVNEPV